jgi:hypothetical protein
VSTPAGDADLATIGRWLARRDPLLGCYDVLVLCGSAVLACLDVAARAVHDGLAGSVLVTGGVGHSTPYLAEALRAHPSYAGVATAGRPEAAVLAELLVGHLGVPAAAVTTEERSTNCGENAALSLQVLERRAEVRRVLLVQDPTMQRRTHASFDHHQRDAARPVEVASHAPFVPVVDHDGVGPGGGAAPAWSRERFASLAVGEVRRLRDDADGYGPRGAGFLDHVDVPADVLAAWARLRRDTPHR